MDWQIEGTVQDCSISIDTGDTTVMHLPMGMLFIPVSLTYC